MHFLHVCPACFVLKILEFVSTVTHLLAAEYAGLPSLGHAVESRSEFLHLPEQRGFPSGKGFEFVSHTHAQDAACHARSKKL